LACGIFDFGTRTGLFLEGILAPWLIKNYGWPTTFRVLGFTALLWLIPWFWATPRDFRDRNAPTRNVSWTNFFDHTADLLANRNLFGICLGFFFFDYYWYLLITWLPDYLYTVRKLSILKTGIYASMPFLVFGLSQPLGGWLGDRLVKSGYNEFKARKWIITVAFCSGLFLIPAVQVSNPNFAIALVMLGCFAGLSTPNMLVLLQHCAPPREAGLWTGIFNFVGNIAGILAPIVTGFLIEQTGSYTPPFMLAALAIAAGPLAFWFIVGPASDPKT
jgi:MFS family permease